MSSAESMRRHRAKPENREKAARIVAARSAALADLARLHPVEYETLCNGHRDRLGLPPLRAVRGRPPLRSRAQTPPAC